VETLQGKGVKILEACVSLRESSEACVSLRESSEACVSLRESSEAPHDAG
jgi:hypothetical protein